MRLREIAFARAGDKGDISNICVFPYDEADWDLIRDRVTIDRVRDHFGSLVKGEITRYEFNKLKGVNFVMREALDGGCTISLRTDPHGKSYANLMLDLDI
jgi:hypothetical protein